MRLGASQVRLGASLFIAATLVGTRIFEKLLEVGREMLGKIAAQVDRRFEKLRNYAWNSYGSKLPEQVDRSFPRMFAKIRESLRTLTFNL